MPTIAHATLTLALLATPLATPQAHAAATNPAPDYGQKASWICRPGQEQTCTTGLDATVIAPDGTRTRQPFTPAADPKLDCFYVYPTASKQLSTYADMTLSPELASVTQGQAGRLTAICRLYAPLYRQLTGPGLFKTLLLGETPDWSGPYQDVLAAWRYYLAHDNQGRGVVLVGHSQGTILLQRLIAEEIDGKPVQSRLVAAFLAGDPSLPVPKGTREGGIFKHIPLCATPAETGCAYAWGSYLTNDSSNHIFGKNPADGDATGLTAGCANPAAPAGGPGTLKPYLRRAEDAPATDAPWREFPAALSAACTPDGGGDVLRITILPTQSAATLTDKLQPRRAGWGLHIFDLNLLQGNILDDIAAETVTWSNARH